MNEDPITIIKLPKSSKLYSLKDGNRQQMPELSFEKYITEMLSNCQSVITDESLGPKYEAIVKQQSSSKVFICLYIQSSFLLRV
jgi:hypothetical protein